MRMSLIAALALVLCATPLWAHYLWVNVDNYHPKPGQEITISLGWGHLFPNSPPPKADRIEKLYIVSPEGKIMPLEVKPGGEEGRVAPVKVRLEKEGTYLVVAEPKSGFVAKTTRGYVRGKTKKELKNVIRCFWSESCALAVINVGEAFTDTYKKAPERRYQLVLLENPVKLRVNDILPVKVMLDGKPHRTWVYATYSGFSSKKDTFAYATRTSKEGVAEIKLLKEGIWLVKASDKLPYPNLDEADEFSFTYTITFEVKR